MSTKVQILTQKREGACYYSAKKKKLVYLPHCFLPTSHRRVEAPPAEHAFEPSGSVGQVLPARALMEP